MKRAWAFVLMGLTVSGISMGQAHALEDFPPTPDTQLTPGSLCTTPDGHRYGERVPYCERSVDGTTKQSIFESYRELGFKISPNQRHNYKIDHLIPLCAGGSNEVDNLWPQYVTIYTMIDPLEPAICQKMAIGRLRQREAVDVILRAKHFPPEAPKLIEYINSL